jgi:hypothetical protein
MCWLKLELNFLSSEMNLITHLKDLEHIQFLHFT